MSKQQFEPLIVQISKMNLGENDYLFLKFPDNSPHELMKELNDALKNNFPNLHTMIYDFPLELSVVHQEEKENEK